VDLTTAELARWDPWSPREVAHRLEGVDVPWYVLAGWALDLFQGRQMRRHDDIEIGVPADRFDPIRAALAEFELFVVGGGRTWPLTDEALASHRQTWVREPATDCWRLDVVREPWSGDVWVFQRDPRIRVHGSQLVSVTDDGIPYAQPEVVLLFKAKAPRPKDEDDFRRTLPGLDDERRRWLAGALELVHPSHHWIEELTS
jgi:Aminoglycoside-2''-adenylyltransferase